MGPETDIVEDGTRNEIAVLSLSQSYPTVLASWTTRKPRAVEGSHDHTPILL